MNKQIFALLTVTVMMVGLFNGFVFADGASPVEIRSAEEFAKMSPTGNYILKADITANIPYSSSFAGTFDGDGHTVTLNLRGSSAIGMFSSLSDGAHIKNLFIEGTVVSTASSSAYAGAIVGRINGLSSGKVIIENCLTNAEISGSRMYMGGILGQAFVSGSGQIVIKGCGNTGSITGSGYVGGLIGAVEGDVRVSDSYNQGTVKGTSNFGGLIGRGWYTSSTSLAPVFTNCYSTGSIVKTYTAGGALFGSMHSNASASNCYALENTAEKLDAGSNSPALTNVEFKADTEMKSNAFAELLGSGFIANPNGYPMLSWQTPSVKTVFDISPQNAVLTVKDSSGKVVITSTDGESRILSLAAGNYTYDVSCEGYVSQNNLEFTVTEEDVSSSENINIGSIALLKDESLWGKLSFEVLNSEDYDIKINLNNADFILLNESNSAAGAELLLNKEYEYTIIPSDYDAEVVTGKVNLISDICETISMLKVTGIEVKNKPIKSEYNRGDVFFPDGMVVTVTYNNGSNADIYSEDFESRGVIVNASTDEIGDEIPCNVSYKGAAAEFTVKINEKPMPGEGILDNLKGFAAVEFSSKNYSGDKGKEFIKTEKDGYSCLMSNVCGVNSGEAVMTLQILGAEDDVLKLCFDYKVSSEKSYSGTVYDGMKINNDSKIGGEVDWSTHTMTVRGGDNIVISYTKDSGGNSGEDCVWLKNFCLTKINPFIFTLEPKDTEIVLVKYGTDENETAASENIDNGSVLFYLENGTYEYTASKFGYLPQKGVINLPNDTEKNVILTESTKNKAELIINVPDGLNASDAEITVKYNDEIVVDSLEEAKNVYSLPSGEYSYIVTHPNCNDEFGTFVINNTEILLSVNMTRKLVFADFFEDIRESVTAFDSSYSNKFVAVKNDDLNYLESTNTSGSSKIEIELKKAGRLDFKYWLSAYGYANGYYGMFVKRNDDTIEQFYGDKEWTDYSIYADIGDKIIIEFYAYSYGGGYENIIRLSDFTFVPLNRVAITEAPSGVSFTVKDSEGTVREPIEDVWLLENGEYTYSAYAFGYQPLIDIPFTVDSDREVAVNMTADTKYNVAFSVELPQNTDSSYSIKVKHGDVLQNPESDMVTYKLSDGEYSYVVTADGCYDFIGSFNVDGKGQTIKIILEKKLVFDDFFSDIPGVTAANDASYPYKAVKEADDAYLESTNTSSYASSTIKLNLPTAGRLSFEYCEPGSSSYSSSSYGLFVSYGSVINKHLDNKTAWTSYDVAAPQGEVSLRFTSSSYYCPKLQLKNILFVPFHKVTFNTIPENAVVTVSQGDIMYSAESDGTYLLPAGDYTYSVSAFGYCSIENQLMTVGDDDKTVNVVMAEKPLYAVEFSVTKPEQFAENSINIKFYTADGYEISPRTDTPGIYKLPVGEYIYTVTCDGCDPATGSFTIIEENRVTAIDVALEKAWTINDYFDGTAGVIAESGSMYAFVRDENDKNILITNNQDQNSSVASMSLAFTRDAKLSFKYKVSSETNYDKLNIYLDNGDFIVSGISGEVDWTECSVDIKAGNVIKFEYTKDSMSRSGTDSVYLKDFVIAEDKLITDYSIKLTGKQEAVAAAPEEGKYYVIFAAYKGNALINIDIVETVFDAPCEQNIKPSAKFNPTEADCVKAIFWQSLSDAKPLCTADLIKQ